MGEVASGSMGPWGGAPTEDMEAEGTRGELPLNEGGEPCATITTPQQGNPDMRVSSLSSPPPAATPVTDSPTLSVQPPSSPSLSIQLPPPVSPFGKN